MFLPFCTTIKSTCVAKLSLGFYLFLSSFTVLAKDFALYSFTLCFYNSCFSFIFDVNLQLHGVLSCFILFVTNCLSFSPMLADFCSWCKCLSQLWDCVFRESTQIFSVSWFTHNREATLMQAASLQLGMYQIIHTFPFQKQVIFLVEHYTHL